MYEFFEMCWNVKTSQTAQFHSIYLSTDTDKHKQGDTHCKVGYRPDWGGNIKFRIPCI